MIMNLCDQLTSLFWLAISIFVCLESIRVDVGTPRVPGPGFLPFWAGVVLGTSAIIILVKSISKRYWQKETTNLGMKKKKSVKVVWVLFSLLLYLFLLPIIGYLISTFGLMTFLLLIMGRSKLWIHGLSAIIIVLASYLIFCVLLDVRLPRGVLGF